MPVSTIVKNPTLCEHCGETCINHKIRMDEHIFCCEGCKMVYQIINQHGLCDYYDLNQRPGITQKIKIREDKFAFLDDEAIQQRLTSFRDEQQVHATFYLPQMHCSSCLYLLENLHQLNAGIISAKVNFVRKEVAVILNPALITLRKTVELLTSIGYEPYISLNDLGEKRPVSDKSLVYQVGVAGFCFGNIMLMSFPEYLGVDASDEALRGIFRWANAALSIPVLLYAARPFFVSAWKGLKHRYLNIDAPIALAVLITFIRSMVEVIGGMGGGYFDSMTGIVFFMLIGRLLQDRTYHQLSFDRDYTSYFPVAVTVLKNEVATPAQLPDIKAGDTLLIHHEELIPADGILSKGKAMIDYSFVTGESVPVLKEVGEIVYAGGKQTAGNMELLVIREVSQSYLTKLWNREDLAKPAVKEKHSFVNALSRYFTWIVFLIAIVTGIYWAAADASKLWPAVTAIFIIACPCALLLSNSFTNGSVLQILGQHKFYLRNAQTIEEIAGITHIVFDKTGTLTDAGELEINFHGTMLTEKEGRMVGLLASNSTHPLSRAISNWLNYHSNDEDATGFREMVGHGTEANIDGQIIRLGSAGFVGEKAPSSSGTRVYLSIDQQIRGYFEFSHHYRAAIPGLLAGLKKKYPISVISGDHDADESSLRELLGPEATLLFRQQPVDKLNYIKKLQRQGERVMMIGDGLNDAGALRQSNAGVAISQQTNHFTPASDAIIEAGQLNRLQQFIQLCKNNRKIVLASFVLSIVYNIAGLYFAVQGTLSPMIAAILMPSSSLSIVLLTYGSSHLLGRRLNN